MDLYDKIEFRPKICNGKPVIKGTRIPVSVILDHIAEGESWQSILEGYPESTSEDIHAALCYAKVLLYNIELEAINV